MSDFNTLRLTLLIGDLVEKSKNEMLDWQALKMGKYKTEENLSGRHIVFNSGTAQEENGIIYMRVVNTFRLGDDPEIIYYYPSRISRAHTEDYNIYVCRNAEDNDLYLLIEETPKKDGSRPAKIMIQNGSYRFI